MTTIYKKYNKLVILIFCLFYMISFEVFAQSWMGGDDSEETLQLLKETQDKLQYNQKLISELSYLKLSNKEKNDIIHNQIEQIKSSSQTNQYEKSKLRCYKRSIFFGFDPTKKCPLDLTNAPNSSKLILDHYNFFNLDDRESKKRLKILEQAQRENFSLSPLEKRLEMIYDRQIKEEKDKREQVAKNEFFFSTLDKEGVNCQNIDEIDLRKNTDFDIPTYQANTDTCYAQSLATALSIKLNQYINPYDIAISYQMDKDDSAIEDLGWGSVHQAFHAAKRNQVCNQPISVSLGHINQITHNLSKLFATSLDPNEIFQGTPFYKKEKMILEFMKANPSMRYPPLANLNISKNDLLKGTLFPDEDSDQMFTTRLFEFLDLQTYFIYQSLADNLAPEIIATSLIRDFRELNNQELSTLNVDYQRMQNNLEVIISNFVKNPKSNIITKNVLDFYDMMTHEENDMRLCISSVENELSALQNLLNMNVQIEEILSSLNNNPTSTAKDISRLAITPECLNPKYRISIDDFKIQSLFENLDIHEPLLSPDQKKLAMKQGILQSFMKGNAVIYDIPEHSMSLLGVRFNKNTQRCEVRVHDTSLTQSGWVDINSIINKSEAMYVLD